MRKVLMIGVMILLVGGYIAMLQKEPAQEIETNSTILTTQSLLETMPETPEELIEVHNKLMKQIYNSQTTEQHVKDLVATMRMLYSKAFLTLNAEVDQEYALIEELLVNQINKVYLIDSKLDYIKYHDKESEAEAIVVHQTTKGDQKRSYFLVQEDGQWKINSWENIQSIALPKTPEEK